MGDGTKSYVVPATMGVVLAFGTGLFVYLDRSNLSGWQLSANQGRIWEVMFKAIAGFLAIFGTLMVVMKYLDDKIHATDISRREARKNFSIKQQEVYFKVLDATSTVASGTKGAPDRIGAARFWHLYWGEIVLVEDHAVAKAVDAFSDALWKEPDNSVNLLNASMSIARACRDSLGATWKVEQAALPVLEAGRSGRARPR